MRIVTDIGSVLTTLPANASNPDTNAGLTFTVSRQALSYPSPDSCAALLAEKLAALTTRIRMLADVVPSLSGSAAALDQITVEWRRIAALGEATPSALSAAPDAKSPSSVSEPKYAPTEMASQSVAPPKPEVAVGKDVTIIFDTARCIHARHCVLGEPNVFLANTPGEWIHPDHATPERIAIVANNCPSGAVMYQRNDGGPNEAPPNVNVVRVRENGPLAFHAELSLAGASEASCKTRATLCRCGQSKSKPYCDGAHATAGFSASGEPATVPTEPLSIRRGPLSVTPLRDGPLEVCGNLELLAGTGRTINRLAVGNVMKLCRCGGSASKPYCDGTHRMNGFSADGA
jgi:CDGSH-type Zn-finger protein/uncharacterized Fe-S cluster protein YjdI